MVLRHVMDATIVEELDELGVLLLQDGRTLIQQYLGTRRVLNLCQEHLGQREGIIVLVFDGLVSDNVQDLTDAAILVTGIVPAVDTIDMLEPGRNRQLGVEALPGLISRTATRVDGALILGPVLDGRGMMIDAVHRERTRLHPHITNVLRNAYVQKKNVRGHELFVARPGRALVGRNGKHVHNSTIGLEGRVGNVGGEPAINAVAVEDEGVLGREVRHGYLE